MKINLLNDWKLLGFNIRAILNNQRIGNFPYFWGIIGIAFESFFINLILILGIVENLTYKGVFSLHENVTYSSNFPISENSFLLWTFIVNLLIAFILSECVRRRVNDYTDGSWGRCGQIVVIFINILFLLVWGYNQEISNVNLRSTLEFYTWLGYEYFILLIIALLPSNPSNNAFGLANGAQIQAGLVIEFDSIIPKKEHKKEDELDRIGLSSALDNSKTVFIEKIFDFTGRAKRGELYWGVFVFQLITSVLGQLLMPIYDIIPNADSALLISLVIYYIAYVWYCLGNLSCSIRRLHDTGRSGYWMLAMLLPLVNVYVMYLLAYKPSIVSMYEYNSDDN